ncbi:MAG: GPR endopeptidase [Clostridia bacterium]|nr:GPR endopeptidase [Clostridia bacterium]
MNFWREFSACLDLALESQEVWQEKQTNLPGVRVEKENLELAQLTTVYVETEEAGQALGKKPGKYLTLEAPLLKSNNPPQQKALTRLLGQKLRENFPLPPQTSVLIVGLGNWKATPDALGPKVVHRTMVTRHLFSYAPKELLQGMRSVCAVAPGVLGLTGLETWEIVQGIVQNIQPDLIIAIDSLTARHPERIATAIQITDSGINPGSGVGNQQKALNQETLGIPVLALGVPTVLNAAIIAREALQQGEKWQNISLPQEDIIQKVFASWGGQLIVTPKEIDELINRTAQVIAGALTQMLHPNLQEEDYLWFLN